MVQLSDLFSDPQYFPYRIEPSQNLMEFVAASRDELSSASFLDDRFATTERRRIGCQLAEAESHFGSAGFAQQSPVHYLFHTGFCCSTLLARCLDMPGVSLSLKEPVALESLGYAKRSHDPMFADPRRRRGVLEMLSYLYSRPNTRSEAVLIKPTHFINNLLPDILELTDARLVLLYGDLRNFLISVLKKGEEGRAYGRRLFYLSRMDDGLASQIDVDLAIQSNDLQIAAIAHLDQLSVFRKCLAAFGPRRVRSLKVDHFLADPAGTLSRLADYLGLDVADGVFGEIAGSRLFRENAKAPGSAYSPERRLEESRIIEERNFLALEIVETWCGTISDEPVRGGDLLHPI